MSSTLATYFWNFRKPGYGISFSKLSGFFRIWFFSKFRVALTDVTVIIKNNAQLRQFSNKVLKLRHWQVKRVKKLRLSKSSHCLPVEKQYSTMNNVTTPSSRLYPMVSPDATPAPPPTASGPWLSTMERPPTDPTTPIPPPAADAPIVFIMSKGEEGGRISEPQGLIRAGMMFAPADSLGDALTDGPTLRELCIQSTL